MRVLALDLATRTGWAFGAVGKRPSYGVERMKKPTDPVQQAARKMGGLIRNFCYFESDRPDLIVYEAPLTPFAGHNDQRQRSIESVIMPQQLVGAVEGMAEVYGVRCEALNVNRVRKHFIGRANLGDREATKAAIIGRCRLLGYVPADFKDDNACDALACWDMACAVYGGYRPERLVLFGERA